jgi:hypothetical protein
MVRALCARLKSNNCGSRTAGEVLFFARAKKSNLPWVSHPQVTFKRQKPPKAAFDPSLPVAARGATKFVAPVRRREHTLSVFTKTPPYPAFAGMTSDRDDKTLSGVVHRPTD